MDTTVKALVGVAKCPKTNQLYGVRIDTTNRKWVATWAFPIKPEIAKREGYVENQFPPDIAYAREYPGCPYCRKTEDLAAISKPKSIPRKLRISVTSSGCDDIGSILSSMKINYSPFSTSRYQCDILFVNCLTSDNLRSDELRSYVNNGGCLYASCYADTLVKEAFPGIFNTDHSGRPHTENVTVEDPELRSIIGNKISVEFDTAWAKLYSAKNSTCILRSTNIGFLPIMVSLKYGKGTIFFTCFHNHVQASEKEKALLQLLVLKQLGSNSNQSIEETGAELGIDIEKIKSKFRSNW